MEHLFSMHYLYLGVKECTPIDVSYMAGDFLDGVLIKYTLYISRSGRMSSYRSLVDGW